MQLHAAKRSPDVRGPLRGSFRVLRGGEWNEKSPNLQASYRGWDDVDLLGTDTRRTLRRRRALNLLRSVLCLSHASSTFMRC